MKKRAHTWRETPSQRLNGPNSRAELSNDGRYEHMNMVVRLDLDELWNPDRAGLTD
jgi:hypothetical protein